MHVYNHKDLKQTHKDVYVHNKKTRTLNDHAYKPVLQYVHTLMRRQRHMDRHKTHTNTRTQAEAPAQAHTQALPRPKPAPTPQ